MKPILQYFTETRISKYVSLYETVSKIGDKIKTYHFISRNKALTKIGNNDYSANAVTMFVFNKDKSKMLLIKEFRYSINDYVIGSPAGLIDGDETIEDAARRELYEEIGYTDMTVEKILEPSYSAIGISDEQVACVFVTVDDSIQPKQNLEGTEDITYFWVTKNEAEEFLATHKFPNHADVLDSYYTDIEGKTHIREYGVTTRTQLILNQFSAHNTCK